nr:hypothetical protein [uncultured Mucilaginibacter sp.]
MSILICAVDVSAQTPLKKNVNDKISSLRAAGVDTIINYHPYCVGCALTVLDTNGCNSFDREYLIWKKKGQGFVQLFDQCYNYLPEKGGKAFVTLLTKNFPIIIKEDLKPVEFKQLVNGKMQHFISEIDHSYHQDFVFYIKGKVIEKPIDNYVLDTRWEGDYFRAPDDKRTTPPPGKAVNINYVKNQNTYLKKLIDLAEQEIEKIKFTKSP